jgi:hypothetical protein
MHRQGAVAMRVAEVLRPALADGVGFRAFGEQQEGYVRPAAGLVEDVAVGRLVVGPEGEREFVPAGHARDRETLPVGVYCQTRTAPICAAIQASSLSACNARRRISSSCVCSLIAPRHCRNRNGLSGRDFRLPGPASSLNGPPMYNNAVLLEVWLFLMLGPPIIAVGA